MHQCLKFIYFGITLCMFRTAFPSIIRSSRLYIQQQAYVKQIMLNASSQHCLFVCSSDFFLIFCFLNEDIKKCLDTYCNTNLYISTTVFIT